MSEKSEKIVNDGLPGSSNTNQQVLFVPPLNSVPYIGPSSSSTSNEEKPEPAIFLPNSISQEVKNLNAQTKTGLVLTGTADMGLLGPTIGRVDLFESDVSYFFRVSLPGVSVEDNEFRCDVEDNGTVLIKGATTTGEKTVYRYSQIFKMQTQDFCPPGHFTISFKLPGPVNKEEFSGKLEAGIYEGKVKKLCKNSEPEL